MPALLNFAKVECCRPSLTSREAEVLACVAEGLSAKEIGQRLTIAPRTVDRHIDHLKIKIRARNRAHMVALALAGGAIE